MLPPPSLRSVRTRKRCGGWRAKTFPHENLLRSPLCAGERRILRNGSVCAGRRRSDTTSDTPVFDQKPIDFCESCVTLRQCQSRYYRLMTASPFAPHSDTAFRTSQAEGGVAGERFQLNKEPVGGKTYTCAPRSYASERSRPGRTLACLARHPVGPAGVAGGS